MIRCNADKSGRVLTLDYSGHVGEEETRECLETIRSLIDRLQPGFILFSDLSHLEVMDLDCAPAIGEIMEICSAKGMSTVLRIIPDPTKDIGFMLISRFHFHAPVQIRTFESIAEAIRDLLEEAPAASADVAIEIPQA
jgi:hypothetical protein